MIKNWKSILSKIAAVIITILFSIPLYITIVNAFKRYDEIVKSPLALPESLNFENFIKTWQTVKIPLLYKNSIVITGCSLVVLIFVASMAAYVISRKKSRFYTALHLFFMMGLMIPVQVILIPSIKTLQAYHLLKTLPGMILFNCGLYFSISYFLYLNFFKTLPTAIEESAMIDGASKFTIYRKILFPLLKPCTSTVMIFSGMWIWNDFLPPLYILDAKNGSTITTGIYRAIGQYTTSWDTVFSAVILASLPIVIVYFCMQKQFQKGLAAGALKG